MRPAVMWTFVWLILGLYWPAPGPAEPLVELARPGPWAGVSGLIAYRGRLYFVNSQIYVNHNAADIFSYYPGTGTLQFEKRLFSQDAGTPTIINDLLYWPSEDSRFSATYGEYTITNGEHWRWLVAPELRGFHLHAMLGHHEAIYALMSGWRGRIYRSLDEGKHWQLIYEHPSPAGQVSRVTALVAQENHLYFALTTWAQDGVNLLQYEGTTVTPVPGWPLGRSIGALESFSGAIYAVNRTEHSSRLWRSDGQHAAQPLTVLDGYTVYALAATPEALWAATDAPVGGLLWRSTDGTTWQQMQHLPVLPIDLAIVDGQVFVGTYDTTHGGALWGPPQRQAFAVATPPAQMPQRPVHPYTPEALSHALNALDAACSDVTNNAYRQHLLDQLMPLAMSHDPAVGQALSERLSMPLPEAPIALFGGRVHVPAARLARWYLLYAIAIDGHGYVPTTFISQPWTSSPNSAEKYLEPTTAAAWAVAELGQADQATLAALEAALQTKIPDWATGDMAAALHILDSRPFHYPNPSGSDTEGQ